jgi:hypothetical protein
MAEPVWTVELAFREDDRHTRADAFLTTGRGRYHGWGRARRAPGDPDVPMIGEELAGGRALVDLARQLLHAASEDVEHVTGEHVTLR